MIRILALALVASAALWSVEQGATPPAKPAECASCPKASATAACAGCPHATAAASGTAAKPAGADEKKK